MANWEVEQVPDNAAASDIQLSAEEIAWLELKTEETGMSGKIRWGLIGPGTHLAQVRQGLEFVPDAEVYAVASRSQEKADAFGAEFGATSCYGSYEELANDPQVDVAYIGTPNNYHLENTLLCLKAGKHVLCEKPFAVNAKEAQIMIDCAREKTSS